MVVLRAGDGDATRASTAALSIRAAMQRAGMAGGSGATAATAATPTTTPSSLVSQAVTTAVSQARVRLVEEDRLLRTLAVASECPSGTSCPGLWGMTAIRAPQAWKLVAGATAPATFTVRGSVIDTGGQYEHVELEGQLDRSLGATFWAGASVGDGADDHGHGTHVSGTIAGESSSFFFSPFSSLKRRRERERERARTGENDGDGDDSALSLSLSDPLALSSSTQTTQPPTQPTHNTHKPLPFNQNIQTKTTTTKQANGAALQAASPASSAALRASRIASFYTPRAADTRATPSCASSICPRKMPRSSSTTVGEAAAAPKRCLRRSAITSAAAAGSLSRPRETMAPCSQTIMAPTPHSTALKRARSACCLLRRRTNMATWPGLATMALKSNWRLRAFRSAPLCSTPPPTRRPFRGRGRRWRRPTSLGLLCC